jgi:Cys-tRNA(Pro)/Cys-tRNA(Cys) deacylase
LTPAIKVLEQLAIDYQLLRYATATATATEGELGKAAAEALGLKPSEVYKTLIVQLSDERLVVAVVPVDVRLNVKRLAAAAGSKSAKLADPQLAERTTGYLTGGICPLGLKRKLPVFLAEQALADEKIYVSAGRRGMELELRPRDLIRATTATVCSLS